MDGTVSPLSRGDDHHAALRRRRAVVLFGGFRRSAVPRLHVRTLGAGGRRAVSRVLGAHRAGFPHQRNDGVVFAVARASAVERAGAFGDAVARALRAEHEFAPADGVFRRDSRFALEARALAADRAHRHSDSVLRAVRVSEFERGGGRSCRRRERRAGRAVDFQRIRKSGGHRRDSSADVFSDGAARGLPELQAVAALFRRLHGGAFSCGHRVHAAFRRLSRTARRRRARRAAADSAAFRALDLHGRSRRGGVPGVFPFFRERRLPAQRSRLR